MTQVFIVGASGVYGVGGPNGGWADMIKTALHQKMYDQGGLGEKYEVYNFGKSGGKISFVKDSFPEQIKQYGRKDRPITIVSVGGNNSKAKNSPDNFVSTIDEYSQEMEELLDILRDFSQQVIAVGGGWYDETKTCPKISPFDDSKSYFSNQRKQEFEKHFKKLCKDRKIPFVDIDVEEDVWKKKYLYDDGLHANDAGHRLIADKVMAVLEKYI